MTLDELRAKGYRFRVGLGHWTVFYGPFGASRTVGHGYVRIEGQLDYQLERANNAAEKAAIGAATADFVIHRVAGRKI